MRRALPPCGGWPQGKPKAERTDVERKHVERKEVERKAKRKPVSDREVLMRVMRS